MTHMNRTAIFFSLLIALSAALLVSDVVGNELRDLFAATIRRLQA